MENRHDNKRFYHLILQKKADTQEKKNCIFNMFKKWKFILSVDFFGFREGRDTHGQDSQVL